MSSKGSYRAVKARLTFESQADLKAVLDLLRRFSAAQRYAYNRLVDKDKDKEAPKYLCRKESVPGRARSIPELFGLNARYAADAVMRAQMVLERIKKAKKDPQKVVFGGRRLFEDLKKHHNPKLRAQKLARWRERRKGSAYARGDSAKKGNLNMRLEPRPDGLLFLRINTSPGRVYARVKTAHRDLGRLLARVSAGECYSVELSLKEGRVYATFIWEESLPHPTSTLKNGVLGVDVNADPYHLALSLVSPKGELLKRENLPLEEIDRLPNRGARELFLWQAAHRVVALAKAHGVGIAVEHLRHLPRGRRGDGRGRRIRKKLHRFAYRSLLSKIRSAAARNGVEVAEVNPADTSTIGMIKYAPQLAISKDSAGAYVIGRRALGLKEKLPRRLKARLEDPAFTEKTLAFYQARVKELEKEVKAEKKPYIKRRRKSELRSARRALELFKSLQGETGRPSGSTDGRNPAADNPWRVLRAGLFLPCLGSEVPRDLSALRPLLHGAWAGSGKNGPGPPPGGGPPRP